MGWLYVVPDAGNMTTPSVMAAFSVLKIVVRRLGLLGVPLQLLQDGDNFCGFHLIIKYQLVLVMHGLEYALNTDVVAIAQFGVAPYKHINCAAAARALQLE